MPSALVRAADAGVAGFVHFSSIMAHGFDLPDGVGISYIDYFGRLAAMGGGPVPCP